MSATKFQSAVALEDLLCFDRSDLITHDDQLYPHYSHLQLDQSFSSANGTDLSPLGSTGSTSPKIGEENVVSSSSSATTTEMTMMIKLENHHQQAVIDNQSFTLVTNQHNHSNPQQLMHQDQQQQQQLLPLLPAHSQYLASSNYSETQNYHRSPPPNLSSPTDQLSSSGESGYFDTNHFTDLHTILELDHQMQQQDLSQQQAHVILTPAATPEESKMQWTYLEPVKMASMEPLPEISSQLMTPSGHDRISWSHDSSLGVVIKSESPKQHANNQVSEYPSPLVQAVSSKGLVNEVNKDSDFFEQPNPVFQPNKMSKSKMKKSNRKNSGPPKFCHVCGETAGSHSYYGGQVCPSCRAFFRRSVQSRYSDVYTCSKNKNCVITLKTRKNCQYCRFKLCEQAGMRRSWVLAGGEKRSSMNVNAGSAVDQTSTSPSAGGNGSAAKACSPLEMLPTEPVIPLTASESELVQETLEAFRMSSLSDNQEIDAKNASEFADLIRNKSSKMSPDLRSKLINNLTSRVTSFAHNVSHFGQLSDDDQMSLVSGNLSSLLILRLSILFYRPDFRWRRQLKSVFGHESDRMVASNIVERTNLEDKAVHATQVFDDNDPVRLPDNEIYLMRTAYLIEDDVVLCLVSLILLFNSDSVTLRNPSLVESHQLVFSHLLHRYLQSIHGTSKARARFAAAIRVVAFCRQMAEQKPMQ